MNPFRLILFVAAAFAALFVLRRILLFVRGGISVETMNELKAKGALIVDVRTSGEFAAAAAPGSLNIPLDQLAQRLGELDRSKPIILCCASGARSGYAQRFLQQAGYPEVYNAGPWQRVL
jgi:rhodanese-related sulfurtransferase